MQISEHMCLARCLRRLRFLGVLRGWDKFLHLAFNPYKQEKATLNFPFSGVDYPGSTSNLIDYNAFFYGAYERQWLWFCLEKLGGAKSATVIDVGGNVGHHALWFAAHGCQVHSFEPNPALWPEIENKASISDLPGTITLHRTALGARDEARPFNLPNDANTGTGSFEHRPGNWSGKSVDFEISAATEYLKSNGIEAANLVKIDVEGFELDVLTGLQSFLKMARPILWVEISARTPGRRLSISRLRDFLAGEYCFYRAVPQSPLLASRKFVETDRIPDQESVDIIAVPDTLN